MTGWFWKGMICSSFNYRSSHKKVTSKFSLPFLKLTANLLLKNQCLESMKGGQKTYFQRRTCCLFQISVFCSTNFELQNQLQSLQEAAGSSFHERKMMSIRKKTPWVLERRPQHKDDPPHIFDGIPCSNLVYKMGSGYHKWTSYNLKKRRPFPWVFAWG